MTAGTPLLIAQISDLHIGFDGDEPDERNTRRCAEVLAFVGTLDPVPDLLVVTGDLTERGDPASYRRLKAMLAGLPMPVKLMTGNHDRRAAMLAAFPETPVADGFVQEAIELDGRRLILLDTLEEGRAGGAFDEARADWLASRLAERPDAPTLLALHHPPFAVGIDWMDPMPDAPWIGRLARVVAGAPQVAGMMAGHLHRPIATMFAGRPFVVASSVAPQIALDFRQTDVDADGRALIVEEPPSFVLHRWADGLLASHFVRVEPKPALARLDGAMVPVIAGLRQEGPGD